jgi:hypothetical protein
MATRSHTNLSIIEAVETLSNIADLEFDQNIGIAQKHETIIDNEKVTYKTLHWLHQKDSASTVNLVKDIFRVILHYLRQFYRREYSYVTDPKTIEGIKTIMVLVGEAAKKLDKYTTLFHQAHMKSIMETKEYKQLQEFYLSKIARKIDEGVLGKWILGLYLGKLHQASSERASKTEVKPFDTQYVFIDLETVKKDTEYELFFIRKEDGSRFFSPRLLRNIKLVSDFGSYFGGHQGIDPLGAIKTWQDRVFHVCARNILKVLGNQLEHFFHDMRQVKDHELVGLLSKALFALMLSSHSHNLLRHQPVKSCAEYFEDFQSFLRLALNHKIYQRWIAYPPQSSNHLASDLLNFIHTLCRALYANLQGLEEMEPIVVGLVKEASQQVSTEHGEEAKASDKIWNYLANDYASMLKLIKKHPNGPLIKVLEVLEENTFHVFDPLLQHNLPNTMYDLYLEEQRLQHIRFSAPIHQEFINKALINEEFKGFLRHYQIQSPKKKHLLINLQDRTSWREHARCVALEELQEMPEMKEVLTVVTLATDTDFYHQLSPYHQINHADVFIKQFKEHIKGETSGFYFPPSIDKKQLFHFINHSIDAIHKIFFSNKNVLLKEHRMDFIEIFYLLLQLKLIDLVQPTSFSLTCKDTIDIGQSYSVELFILLQLINHQTWTESDRNFVNFLLYAPALLIRERILLAERFNRMISAVRTIENVRHEYGEESFYQLIQEVFKPLFKSSVLEMSIQLPR